MNDIINHKHTFTVDGKKIVLNINNSKGVWKSDIVEGKTGCSGSQGGRYDSLKDYTEAQEKEHTYIYNFFNKGHAFAKAQLSL